MSNKWTVIVLIIVGTLLLAIAGRYSILLVPGTISWIITIIAGNQAVSRHAHALWGMLAAIFLLVQVPVLMVVLQVCEMARDDTRRNPHALALIIMFLFYLVSLANYFGRGPKSQPNQSPRPPAANAGSSAARPTPMVGSGSGHGR
jgi:glucan phosphoethanolaminetransferase (alkaline phosphatase superfamily)